MDEKFWTEDPYILFKDYYIIIPTSNMSRVQQLNSATRIIIIFILLCILFGSSDILIICLLIGIILIVVFFYIYKNDPKGIQTDLIKEAEKFETEFNDSDDNNNCQLCKENLELNIPLINIYDKKKNKVFKGDNLPNTDFQVESGFIDSDGNYKIGPNYLDINYSVNEKAKKKQNEKKVSFEKNELYVKDTCRKPTIENPFTNIVFSDYLDSGNLAVPCNVDDDTIQNQKQNLYNSSIYRNLSDVWERENSQRMFYTVPIQTVPNDQMDFANWLYKTGPSCHENTDYCTYYQDPLMISSRY